MKKFFSFMLVCTLIATMVIMPTSAYSWSDAEVLTVDEAVAEYELLYDEEVETNRYYFLMPNGFNGEVGDDESDGGRFGEYAPSWFVEMPNGDKATNTAGIYWWGSGVADPPTWIGYLPSGFDENDPYVFYADVPKAVTTILWNNAVDGGVDPSQELYYCCANSVNIDAQYYESGECDYYPNGTESFDNMIFVIDPDLISINDLSHKQTCGGEWYYYYGNGCYGIVKDGNHTNCIRDDHYDNDNNHIAKQEISTEEPTEGTTEKATEDVTESADIPDGLTYSQNENQTITITGYSGTSSVLNIPPTIEGMTVEKIASGAFAYNNVIETVNMPDTVATIGFDTFYSCENLEYVYLSNNITILPSQSFSNCPKLKSVDIPCGVTTLETEVFSNSGISFILIPETVTNIGSGSFAYCTSLEEITIPKGVSTIEYSTFEGCTSLSKISLPDTIKHIGEFAFKDTAFYCDEYNWNLDLLYIGEYLIEAKKDIGGIYAIREGTRVIANNAFYTCSQLTEIIIPEGVISIGDWAFMECPNLVKITMPRSLETIHSNSVESNLPVIYGYKGTIAESYAKESNNEFVALDTPQTPVENIEIMPITIIDGTNGYIATDYDLETEKEYEYYHYSPQNNMEYTITWTDGTVTTGSEAGVEYNGEYYWFDTVTEQSYLNQWKAGNTYTMKSTLMGVTVEVPVTIEKSPVKSVSIKPISLIEGTSGYVATDYDWETETECEYYCYQPENNIEYTVVWSDGSVSTGSGNTVEYNEEYFWFETVTKQSYLNKWEAGNSYSMSVWFMGVSVEVPVTIENSPIEEIVFEPITLVERVHGYQSSDYNDETGEMDLTYFRYAPENNIKYTIRWSNGTTTEGTESGFVHNGEYVFFDFNTDQSYWNQWEVENSYLMTAFLMGVSVEVPVTIEPSPINSIEMIKAPNKCTYEQGEFMNPEGAILRVEYIDGTYEDLSIGLYDYLAGSYVYIERFATEVPIRLKTDNVEINNKYYISFMGYDVPVDVTVNSRDLQIIVIQNKGYDLEITAVYDGGQQKTFKALGFRAGLGDGVDNLQMWGGNLVTDNGVFFAQMWENTETGEFFIKWRVGEQYVTSNTLDNCPWWDLQQRISDVAWALQPLETAEFDGEITAENIDGLITVAISVTDLRYDEGAYISGTLFRADSVKVAFYETFGVIPDLSLSSNYNAKDKTYEANLYGFGGRGYKVPFVIDILENEIVVKVEWHVENTQRITFDKDLYIKKFSTQQNEFMMGDVDGDGDINIMDVTEIQRHIAQLTTISDERIACADTDKDGDITIMDATRIQRFIAQLIPEL